MKVNMTDWCPFGKRDELDELKDKLDSPGVYFIAKDVRRNRQPSIQCRNIIYIGRATNLGERLKAFEKSCEFFFRAHAGGQTFHKAEINRRFQEEIDELRETYGNRARAREAYIERCQEFEERWVRRRNRLSLAVWTPADGGRGKFTRLPKEHRPTYVEMALQAEFLIRHDRLPKYNKRIG